MRTENKKHQSKEHFLHECTERKYFAVTELYISPCIESIRNLHH